MRKTTGLMALLSLAACGPNWQEVTFPQGRIAADFPGTPTEKVQRQRTPVGTIAITFQMFERRSGAFGVAWSDYPAEVMEAADPDTILDGAREGAAQNLKGKVIADRRITFSGKPGREFEFDFAKGRAVVRVCLDGPRLYQAMFVGLRGEIASADVTRFLDSVQILEGAQN